MTIKEVKATEVLDSRGIPTVRVDLKTNKGSFSAITPSGTSSGKYEAFELRDGNLLRYFGKGVKKAVNNINKIIAPKILGLNEKNQKEIDEVLINLDSTVNKSNLGANAILPVSTAVCRAGAKQSNMPLYKYIAKLSKTKTLTLPVPLVLVLEGGKHATKSSDFQEFMILIKSNSFKKTLEKSTLIYKTIRKILTKNKKSITVGMEGAFPSPFKDNEKPLQLILQAAKMTKQKSNLKIAIDIAASEFYKKEIYNLKSEKKHLTSKQLSKYYLNLRTKYPLELIEDPFDQDDWTSWKSFTKHSGKNTIIIGDDFLTTNPKRIKNAIKKESCNALLVKPNQIGTITETLEAINLAKKSRWDIIISHRSGDTSDPFIADLAVGTAAKFIKTGAPSRSERLAKYNRILKIEQELGKKAIYHGKNF